MSDLLAQVLVTALVLAVPATASVFLGEPSRPRVRGAYRALLAAGVVAGSALALGATAGAGAWRSAIVAVTLGVAVLALGPVGRPWTLRGLVAWSLTIAAGVAYLAYVALWMVDAHLGVASFVGGALLWLLQLAVCVLALGHLWELVDVTARWDWRRGTELRREVDAEPRTAGRRPFVSLHVPTHNEPPELVIATLETLVALDYDEFEVLVVDNNTEDPELWRPVERFCRTHEKLGFFHLEDWPGHKAGALNHVLEKVDPRTELVGVVDADVVVDADFLSRCVQLFEGPGLAFVQTMPHDRGQAVAPYFRRLQSYASFADGVQRARNERDAAVFGGSMGLVRRDALVAVGGWDEWCITEGAELGLRLLRAGWSGVHVGRSFGRGLMPLTFEALKRQQFRRCFGGVQLLRLHWRALLPGRRTGANALSPSQRWSHLADGLQWFGDLAGLLLTGFLLVGAVDVFVGNGLVVQRFSAALLVSVIALLVLGSLRSIALLRRTAHVGWREVAGVEGLRLALGWVVALASVRGLVARQAAFLRTPEVRGEVGWRDSARGNVVESMLALACLVGAAAGFAAAAGGAGGGLAVGALLALQGAGYAAAPLNSLAAVRADLTPELRRRRREGLLSWTGVTPQVGRRGIGPVLAGGAAAAAALLVALPVGAPQLGAFSRGDEEPIATSVRPRPANAPTSTQSSLVAVPPLSPLSPLATMLTTTPTGSPTPAEVESPVRPVATTRPTRAATTTAPVPTPQPTQARHGHGRPTDLPTPTKRPH